MATSERVHCCRPVEVDGVLVDRGFDYMQSKESDKWDEELIALANQREATAKRKRR